MPIVVNGQKIETDDEGFLADRREWNEEVALALARTENCELSRDHWEVIHFLRAYYDEYQISPAARVLAKAIGKKLGADKGHRHVSPGAVPGRRDPADVQIRRPAEAGVLRRIRNTNL